MGCGGSCGGTCGGCGGHGSGAACGVGAGGRSSGCPEYPALQVAYSRPSRPATILHEYAMGTVTSGRVGRPARSGALRPRRAAEDENPDPVPVQGRTLARRVDAFGVPVARFAPVALVAVANPRAVLWTEHDIGAMSARVHGPCRAWRRAGPVTRRALATRAAASEALSLAAMARRQGDPALAMDLEAAALRIDAGETPRLIDRIIARIDAVCDALRVPRYSGQAGDADTIEFTGTEEGTNTVDESTDESRQQDQTRVTIAQLQLAGQALNLTGETIAAAIESSDRVRLAQITADARVEIASLQAQQASSENLAKIASLNATLAAMQAAAAGQRVAIQGATSSQGKTIAIAVGGAALVGLAAIAAVKLL